MSAVISGTNGLLQSYDYQVLTTGFSYTFAAGTQVLVIDPAGTLATGTITMPASPADGMTVTVSSDQQITALTMSGNGGTIVGPAVQLIPNQPLSWVYRLSNTTWYPVFGGAGRATALVSGTSQASTSGTSIDFTGIPSWAKRITVMFAGVSLSTTVSVILVRIGSGSFEATGYVGGVGFSNSSASANAITNTTGIYIGSPSNAGETFNGAVVITNVSGNLWVAQGNVFRDGTVDAAYSIGSAKTTSGVLDRVQVVLDSTGAFDAGTINILYE
jgi:hypothetical protein